MYKKGQVFKKGDAFKPEVGMKVKIFRSEFSAKGEIKEIRGAHFFVHTSNRRFDGGIGDIKPKKYSYGVTVNSIGLIAKLTMLEDWGTNNSLIIDGKTIDLSDETVKSLKESLGLEKKGRWRAERSKKYYRIWGDGTSTHDEYNDCTDVALHSTGNYYKTEKEAQAVIALKKHIYKMIDKYGEPETDFYQLLTSAWSHYQMQDFGVCTEDKLALHSGIIMHPKSTVTERATRVKLIKAAY